MQSQAKFSNYLVFVDESGDHGLVNIDSYYPVFVLLFVIVNKRDYVDSLCPALQRFKHKYWGHDEIVLHERDIRKPSGMFAFLKQQEVREQFHNDLNQLMRSLPITLVSILIDKIELRKRYVNPDSPYHLAMTLGLERVFKELEQRDETQFQTPVIVESRGKNEDKDLENAFYRVCSGRNWNGKNMPFQIVMTSKASNSAGLQMADLIAHPIGSHYLRPHQANRAFSIIEEKLRRSPTGEVRGWGYKVLP